MILNDPEQWDAEALEAVIAYPSPYKQVWDNTDLGGPWLNVMRNSLNAQIWSFKHPDFLVVSATHGSAHLALFDDATWEKYQLTKLAGEKFKSNTWSKEAPAQWADAKNYRGSQGGVFTGRQFDPGAYEAWCRVPVVPQRDLGRGRRTAEGREQSRQADP